MMKIKYILLALAFGLTAIFVPSQVAQANSYTVPMQILENGSSNTSYAAAYFAGSATVTPSDSGYTVTSTITTDTSLGNYPVQMLSVDGSGVSVSKANQVIIKRLRIPSRQTILMHVIMLIFELTLIVSTITITTQLG